MTIVAASSAVRTTAAAFQRAIISARPTAHRGCRHDRHAGGERVTPKAERREPDEVCHADDREEHGEAPVAPPEQSDAATATRNTGASGNSPSIGLSMAPNARW